MSGEPAYRSRLTLRHDPDSPPATGPGPGDTSDADDERLRLLRHRLAEPVIASLVTGAELERVSVHWDRDRTSGETWVRVVARGEVFEDRLTSPVWGTREDVGDREGGGLDVIDLPLCAARLADHLQDWIAESRFGWGQRRTARCTLPG